MHRTRTVPLCTPSCYCWCCYISSQIPVDAVEPSGIRSGTGGTISYRLQRRSYASRAQTSHVVRQPTSLFGLLVSISCFWGYADCKCIVEGLVLSIFVATRRRCVESICVCLCQNRSMVRKEGVAGVSSFNFLLPYEPPVELEPWSPAHRPYRVHYRCTTCRTSSALDVESSAIHANLD